MDRSTISFLHVFTFSSGGREVREIHFGSSKHEIILVYDSMLLDSINLFFLTEQFHPLFVIANTFDTSNSIE